MKRETKKEGKSTFMRLEGNRDCMSSTRGSPCTRSTFAGREANLKYFLLTLNLKGHERRRGERKGGGESGERKEVRGGGREGDMVCYIHFSYLLKHS